jgi:transposase InsO family protein
LSLDAEREKIETCRRDYNEFWAHSSLDNMTPEAFRLSFEQKLENDKINRELSLALVQSMGGRP